MTKVIIENLTKEQANAISIMFESGEMSTTINDGFDTKFGSGQVAYLSDFPDVYFDEEREMKMIQ